MDVNIKRNILDKLVALSSANTLLQAEVARYEGSWSNIGHIIANFTTVIGDKDSKILELQAQLEKQAVIPLTSDKSDNHVLWHCQRL